MTRREDEQQHFQAVARWWQRRLPAAARGVTVMAPDTAPDGLPRGARVRLDLPQDRLLWREIEVPKLENDRRAAWIASRLDEQSPWAAGAYHWAEGEETAGRLRVALVAAEPIRALSETLRASGRSLVEVTAGALWLIEDGRAQARLARRLLLGWGLALALGLALAGWSWLRIGEAQAAQGLAETRLATLTRTTTTSSAASQAARRLLVDKTEPASLATALDRLATSLPLDSYLETLRLTPADFEISGLSAAPEAIIPALEKAGGFSGVDFAGASALDAASGLYSFALAGKTGGAAMKTPWRALAIVGLAPLAVLALAVAFLAEARQAEADAAASQARLMRAMARPAVSPEAEAMALLVPGETAGLAASAFQALVLASVGPSGAQVTEVAAAPAEDAAPLTRLHLTLQLQASEAQLAAALVALEGAQPLVGVDRLDVQGGSADQGGVLAATLALSAWTGQVAP